MKRCKETGIAAENILVCPVPFFRGGYERKNTGTGQVWRVIIIS